MKQQIVFTHKFEQSLSDSIAKCNPDKIFVLADDTTIRMCYNRIKHFECLKKGTTHNYSKCRCKQKPNFVILCMDGFASSKGHQIFNAYKSWWWNGNRYWGICRSYIQAWH